MSISAKKSKKSKKSESDTISIKKPSHRGTSKTKATKNLKKSSRPKVSLNPLREQLANLVNQANKRFRQLEKKGLTATRAVEEARRTLLKQTSRDPNEGLFNANLKTRRQINREFVRVQTFLNDYTSTVKGAGDFKSDIQGLLGQFGGKWADTNQGKNYNRAIINDDLASQAFEIYRKVVEESGGWERAVGLMKGTESLIGYGSENLIVNIYDMVEQGFSEKTIKEIAKSMVEQGIKAYERMRRDMISDYDYGIVIDDDVTYAKKQALIHRRNRG